MNPADGTLTPLSWTRSGGQTPRFITLDPDGTTLYVANQDSDSMRAFCNNGLWGLSRVGRGGHAFLPSAVLAAPLARLKSLASGNAGSRERRGDPAESGEFRGCVIAGTGRNRRDQRSAHDGLPSLEPFALAAE